MYVGEGMMELKFRAWIKEQYEWDTDSDIPYRMVYLDTDADWWVIDGATGQPIHGEGGKVTDYPYYTIQYIGVKDKNDKYIYQGDIVKVSITSATALIFDRMRELGDDHIYLILDGSDEFLTTVYKTHDEGKYYTGAHRFGDSMFLSYLQIRECMEVVGNIYEDTEFLEEIEVLKDKVKEDTSIERMERDNEHR